MEIAVLRYTVYLNGYLNGRPDSRPVHEVDLSSDIH